MLKVLIIGGYGNFGGYVARKLALRADMALVLAGRDLAKARAAAAALNAANPAQGARVDLADPAAAIAAVAPDLVINMVGPYHTQGYQVAQAAVACGAHYCDIADARDFVCGIGALDAAAQKAGVAVIAGASSVPCLTAAYLDEAVRAMAEVRSAHCGISGAEQANRGAGTVAAVLSYVGQRFDRLANGRMQPVTGWAGLHSVRYPELGRRWFGHGNIPDLGLFPARYPTLHGYAFYAGHEIAVLHFGTWMMGKLVSLGLLPRLDRFAPLLLKVSKLFNWLGNGRSGFHMVIEGIGHDGVPMVRRHWIIARSGDGPNIPCVPVILIAQMLAEGRTIAPGARPCLGLFTREEFMAGMAGLDYTAIDE
ncbi:saccharopine dehydrogenase NADP-binding domain-containing protein [Aurantiacibacter xanthus]|uniref:saccharopine dehydrogenase NADP-binding domain-containing protein n=1 Tax=Aurantiacibacter xanthus TaxID=1784712 RepID=UPI00174A53FD|nr:saccharopine dehydrogenase NADP-binding domain-containing protein [Aurantiacibacter xanthus]